MFMWQLPDIKPADLALISENTDGDNDGEDVMFFLCPVLRWSGMFWKCVDFPVIETGLYEKQKGTFKDVSFIVMYINSHFFPIKWLPVPTTVFVLFFFLLFLRIGYKTAESFVKLVKI